LVIFYFLSYFTEEEYGVGRKLKCVVLSVSVENKCVEVTLSKHVVKAVKNRKQSKINKVKILKIR
jgi:hypothetical protein